MTDIKQNKLKSDAYRNFALISQLGISMMVPIFLMLALGIYLENKFDIFTTIPCLVLGILAGCKNTYSLAMKANRQSEAEKERKKDEKMINDTVKEWNNGRQFTDKK